MDKTAIFGIALGVVFAAYPLETTIVATAIFVVCGIAVAIRRK
jgi:hypothetical protein